MRQALHDAPWCATLILMSTETPLIGTTEAAQLLGVDKTTLTRWVAAGRIHVAARLPKTNGALLFHRDDIEALAARHRAEQVAS